MNYFALPPAYSEMLKRFDNEDINYLSIVETRNGEWNVEGYIIDIAPSKRTKVFEILCLMVEKYGLVFKEQENGNIVCNIVQTAT